MRFHVDLRTFRRPIFAGLLLALGALVFSATSAAKSGSQDPAPPVLTVKFLKPPTLTEGRSSVRVRVVNEGRRELRNVVVAIKPSAGVSVEPARATVKLLSPQKARTIAFAVTVAAGTSSPHLAVTAKTKTKAKGTT